MLLELVSDWVCCFAYGDAVRGWVVLLVLETSVFPYIQNRAEDNRGQEREDLFHHVCGNLLAQAVLIF